jgi:transketolase
MEFTRINYEIIDGYVLVTVQINMVLVAEMRFYVSGRGDHVTQKHFNYVVCSDDDMQEGIFEGANELARKHNLVKVIKDEK